MSEALYRKYRPKVFDDVAGQKYILQTLKNAISNNKISHSYMFCGPRGTGKTTMARLLAKACICKESYDSTIPSPYFCGRCEDCEAIANGVHPDVYELDAASRTGVENVREEIINRVGYAATKGDKKIYIIDEVHMLSTAAFNALLKTLEEPPSHVIFILCTTDPHKVPDTILSRCQRFDFMPIPTEEIYKRLKDVCVKEDVVADDTALKVIAQNSSGAMRNALTKLEQLIAYSDGVIDEKVIKETESDGVKIDYAALIKSLGKRDLLNVFSWIDQVYENGADFVKICRELTQVFRDMYILISAPGSNVNVSSEIRDVLDLYTPERLHRILSIMSSLMDSLRTTTNLRLCFEVAMSRIAYPSGDLTLESLAERLANLEIIATSGDLSNKIDKDGNPKIKKLETENNPGVTAEINKKIDDKKILEENKNQDVAAKNAVKINTNVVNDNKAQTNEANVDKVSANQKNEIKINNNGVDDIDAIIGTASQSNKAATSQINMPKRPQAHDFAQTRENIRNEANISAPAQMPKRSYNLSSINDLQSAWRNAFTNIRNKYPAYGATLLTAKPSYDAALNQFILSFPESANFSVGVLNKQESMEKIHNEIRAVMGQDIGFNIIVEQANQDAFNPQFANKFRENDDKIEMPHSVKDHGGMGEMTDVVDDIEEAPSAQQDPQFGMGQNFQAQQPMQAQPAYPQTPMQVQQPPQPMYGQQQVPMQQSPASPQNLSSQQFGMPQQNLQPQQNFAPQQNMQTDAPMQGAQQATVQPNQNVQSGQQITDMLNSMGAYNITEE